MPDNIKDLITLYLIYLTIKQHCSHIAVQEVSPHLEISLKSHLSHLSAKGANNLIGFFFRNQPVIQNLTTRQAHVLRTITSCKVTTVRTKIKARY